MPKSTSSARSESAIVMPRRYKPQGPRSVGSPARSNTSVRLTSVIQNFKDKNKDSFHLSPLNSRHSVLNDNTDIDEPRRNSWWKKLNDSSRDILEVLENEKHDAGYNVLEEYMDVEVLSQEQKNNTLHYPDSSDSGSICSIVIPQRKLFPQKENRPQNKFAHLLGTRETIAKCNETNIESDENDKTIVTGTKQLFGRSSRPRSKPVFPKELLRFSPDKSVNITAAEIKGQVRSLFGNRAVATRKNKYADFIASESEDEPEIQPKVFAFQKKHDAPSRRISTVSRVAGDHSPTSSVTDIDMEDWKLLPSSTMVQTQLDAMMADTPAKKARLSKLSEQKESETAINSTAMTNKTKQSNKSTSNNKSKLSSSKNSLNKSKTSLAVNTSVHKSARNETENKNDDQNIESSLNVTKKASNKSPQSKSIASKNTPHMSSAKTSLNKSKTLNKGNETVHQSIIEKAFPDNENQEIELQFDEDNRQAATDAILDIHENLNNTIVSKNQEQERNLEEEIRREDKESTVGNDYVNKSNKSTKDTVNNELNLSISKATFNKSKTVNTNEGITKSVRNEVESKEDDQEMELDDENRLALTYSDEEPIEQENDGHSVYKGHDNQNTNDKNVNTAEKIINESAKRNECKEDDEKERSEIQSEQKEVMEEMDDQNQSHDIDSDVPAETEEENEKVDEENASQEVETEDPAETDHEDNEEDEIEAESDVDEGNESQEIQDPSEEVEESHEVENEEGEDSGNEENESQEIHDPSQEIEESHEVENEEGEDSGDEENESQEIIINDEMIDESDGQNDEGTNDEENHDMSITEEETPDVTHDTTGRNRKKDETNLKSPEAILKNNVDPSESFTVKGRNTSVRKTSMIKTLHIRPSLAPPRDSAEFSDGTRNSSAEGSGWDSHRTTRKTLRKTFGRDFTPRKSLRALVMEKSAKRHTEFNDIGMPRANSTELPEASHRDEEENEDPHEMSKRTRQTTLEAFLQKIKEQNIEKKKKLEEEVKKSLGAPSNDIFNPFKVPSRPFVHKRVTKSVQSKPKTRTIKSTIPLGELPQDLLKDMEYKPPKRFQPSNASWITKRLYKFLETKLEPKYDYRARVRAEKLVESIYTFAKDLRRHDVAPSGAVEALKLEMARLSVVDTHFQFYQFFNDYMPREIRVKVIPDVVNNIPLPRHGVFSEILRGSGIQG